MIKSSQTAAEHDFRNAVTDVEDMIGNVAERSRSSARDVQDRALRVLDDAKEKLASIDSRVRSGARYAAEATEDYVRDQPWRAIGLGASAGIVLGLIAGMLLAQRR